LTILQRLVGIMIVDRELGGASYGRPAIRALTALDEDKESSRASREARSRRGLGPKAEGRLGDDP